MQWQPIETAPKDGTVILTDCGTNRYILRGSYRGVGWWLCDLDGNLPHDGDCEQVPETPKWWMPIPPLP